MIRQTFRVSLKAPDILEFVEIQEQYIDLERTYKLLQRRRNIQRIIFEEYQKQTLIRKKSRVSEDRRRQ